MSSATSTTKSPRAAARAFATLRFSGDRLDPDRISDILHVRPTTAYRKGERYYAGPRTGHLKGRTGIWLFATDDVVNSPSLERHLDYLISLIFLGPEDRLAPLHALMAKDGITADVSCFWHGNPGEQPPVVPTYVTDVLRSLPAEIETDFATD